MSYEDAEQQVRKLQSDADFDGEILLGEPMERHTFYRIGGPAFAWATCNSIPALEKVLAVCHSTGMPWCAVGMGANLLVSDRGYQGIIIHLGRNFNRWDFNPQTLQFFVGCRVPLAKIVHQALHQHLSGFEFGTATPGTLGGVLTMNAGRPGDSIGSRVVSLRTLSAIKGIQTYQGSDISWEYRHTSIPTDEVVLDCILQAHEGDSDEIKEKMDKILSHRKAAQPLSAHCCGSVFKNPEGKSAGQLIESCGLKGTRQGGAQISEKHANFIINDDHASAQDVLSLIHLAQRKVQETYHIELHPEVRFLGFDD